MAKMSPEDARTQAIFKAAVGKKNPTLPPGMDKRPPPKAPLRTPELMAGLPFAGVQKGSGLSKEQAQAEAEAEIARGAGAMAGVSPMSPDQKAQALANMQKMGVGTSAPSSVNSTTTADMMRGPTNPGQSFAGTMQKIGMGAPAPAMRKGGAVKEKAYASGGTVSASRRGDGIAQRGKTKGRMV
jgi:hypothetical protein